MASVKQVGFRWRADICVNLIRKSKTFDTQKQAEAWAEEMESILSSRNKNSPEWSEAYDRLMKANGKYRGDSRPVVIKDLTAEEIGIPGYDAIMRYAKDAEDIEQSGVYFLIKKGAIVYVGQSKNIGHRLLQHRRSLIDFDKYCYIQCEENDLLTLEAQYISLFKPKHNKYSGALELDLSKIKFAETIPGEIPME